MEAYLEFAPDVVDAEYRRLRHTLGWRLLTCPERNVKTATVALITANPGGRTFEPPLWALNEGSAYVTERWKGYPVGQERLQRQVQRMFALMRVNPGAVLSGYLVPFRSPDWQSLSEKAASLEFGMKLWRSILNSTKLETVIAFGKEIEKNVSRLFSATKEAQLSAGWGKQTISKFHYGENGTLLVLPHLSRFSLFNRESSESAFMDAIAN